jgi:hypothetical protein
MMSKVIIIVNAQVEGGRISATAPVAERMALALSKSVMDSEESHEVQIISGADLWSKSHFSAQTASDLLYCPLTIKLPDWFKFPAQNIYHECRDLDKIRQWVKQFLGYKTSNDNTLLGDLWLPIILTSDRQLIYDSIISEGMMPNHYQQPYELNHDITRRLKELASELLNTLNAIPSVYLLQFKLAGHDIIFDRLWPFPATPAIASIHPQNINLYVCHWHCLSGKPLKVKN